MTAMSFSLMRGSHWWSCDVDNVDNMFRSSVVEKILLRVHEEGKRFSVIVVDSRPLLEGILDGISLLLCPHVLHAQEKPYLKR